MRVDRHWTQRFRGVSLPVTEPLSVGPFPAEISPGNDRAPSMFFRRRHARECVVAVLTVLFLVNVSGQRSGPGPVNGTGPPKSTKAPFQSLYLIPEECTGPERICSGCDGVTFFSLRNCLYWCRPSCVCVKITLGSTRAFRCVKPKEPEYRKIRWRAGGDGLPSKGRPLGSQNSIDGTYTSRCNLTKGLTILIRRRTTLYGYTRFVLGLSP